MMLALAGVMMGVSISAGFEAQCSDQSDHGWPRFQNLTELQADEPWTNYFKYIYGELPNVFPVCVFDLEALDAGAIEVFGVNKTGQLPSPKEQNSTSLKSGDLYPGGQMGYKIFHESWEPAPAHGWVEVTHSVIPTELSGYWAWRERGSGVWYNVGRTVVFPTPADMSQTHRAAIENLTAGCTVPIDYSRWPQYESDIFGACAREKGYDSIQFEPTMGSHPWGTFGLVGLTELVLVNLAGDKSCGVEEPSKTPLRGGWLANRTCECENTPIAPHCGIIIPQGCTALPGGVCSPPLCQTEPCMFSEPPCVDTWCTKHHIPLQNYGSGHTSIQKYRSGVEHHLRPLEAMVMSRFAA